MFIIRKDLPNSYLRLYETIYSESFQEILSNY